jgi:hypothetical protein
LPDVTLADGDLRIAPLRKNTPESAEAFAEKAYALMPHVKITELLAKRQIRFVNQSKNNFLSTRIGLRFAF